MKRIIKETRKLNYSDLRDLCITKDWFTRGTTEEYEKLLNAPQDKVISKELVFEIATMIKNHSETEQEIESIMFDIARACYSIFKVEEQGRMNGMTDNNTDWVIKLKEDSQNALFIGTNYKDETIIVNHMVDSICFHKISEARKFVDSIINLSNDEIDSDNLKIVVYGLNQYGYEIIPFIDYDVGDDFLGRNE